MKAFTVQDEAAQLVSSLVAPKNENVLDACSGTGGKTMHLAAMMNNWEDHGSGSRSGENHTIKKEAARWVFHHRARAGRPEAPCP